MGVLKLNGKGGGMGGRLLREVGELVDEVSKASKVHSVVLFGSVARGDSNEFSDVDLLLLCGDVVEARRVVYRLGHGFEVSVYSPEELASMAKLGLPFIHHLAREGLVMRDDGSFKMVVENLKDAGMEAVRAASLELRRTMKVYSTLSGFNLPYFAHIFEPLLNLMETFLCAHKIFTFNKEEVVKKFIELNPKLTPIQNYMLNLLTVYRNYVRLQREGEVDFKTFVKTVREVLKAVEKKLQGEGEEASRRR
ncbi:MAG: nucleotidyltransferase domain-containing protein [Candidatus Bathyarchaeia archaeon]